MYQIIKEFLLWGGWLVLPFFLEIYKNIAYFIKLKIIKKENSSDNKLGFKSTVTILIPVYYLVLQSLVEPFLVFLILLVSPD